MRGNTYRIQVSILVLMACVLSTASPLSARELVEHSPAHQLVVSQTIRISVSNEGVEGNARSYSGDDIAVSSDGRYVSFNSLATNLAEGPSPYIYDRITSKLKPLPKGFDGEYLAGARITSISNDGRYILFTSGVTNVVPLGQTNLWMQVYLLDQTTGIFTHISKDANGEPRTGYSEGKLSGDGRYVVYGTNYYWSPSLILRDLSSGEETVVVSGNLSNITHKFYDFSISNDGRFITFEGVVDLIPGGRDPLHANGLDIYLYDRLAGTNPIKRISAPANGEINNEASAVPEVSGDGSVVAFWSQATNLLPCGTPCLHSGLYLYNIATGQLEEPLSSIGLDGKHAFIDYAALSISADGRYIAFISSANNLVPDDANSCYAFVPSCSDVFVLDRITKNIRRASVSSLGAQSNNRSTNPVISGDGSIVAFSSEASNLVANDTNEVWDAFVHELCTGTNCPKQAVKRPVIFVPGMGTSYNNECLWQNKTCEDQTKWSWTPKVWLASPGAEAYNHFLLAQFAAVEYTKTNYLLFTTFHYDWRKPLNLNVARLREHISYIKQQTGATQVDLVGHSEGGLIGRAYVQDAELLGTNDVAHLVTIGVPLRGMPRAYPFWEGGELYRTGWIDGFALQMLCGVGCINNANALQKELPIFRDLLPTYDYVFNANDNYAVKQVTSLFHQNNVVGAMNSPAGLQSLTQHTKVTAIYGTGQDTPVKMVVEDRSAIQSSASSRLRIGVADKGSRKEAPEQERSFHEQEIRCAIIG